MAQADFAEQHTRHPGPADPRPSSFPTSCYLCGGRRLELRFPARGALHEAPASYNCTSLDHGRHPPIWRCSTCGLLAQWPMPDGEALRQAYEEVEDPLYVSERENRYHTFRRVAGELGPPGGRRLLDVGAYCGYFVDVARQAGFTAEGAELSLWAVSQARQLGLTMHNETVAERARSGERYDVVTMWDVVEHLADPRAELTAAFRLLEPGGSLHLSTIDARSMAARLLGRRWPWLMDMHLFYFDRSTITMLLSQAGFRVDRIGHYTHVVSADYLVHKAEAALGPAAGWLRKIVPGGLRVPVNLRDNMHVVAHRPL